MLGTLVAFALGIIIGGAIFNKDFRQKIFAFLGRINRNAGNRGQKPQYPPRPPVPRLPTQEPPAEPTPQPPEGETPLGKVEHQPRLVPCPRCGGSGQIPKPKSLFSTQAYQTCPDCEGGGTIFSQGGN